MRKVDRIYGVPPSTCKPTPIRVTPGQPGKNAVSFAMQHDLLKELCADCSPWMNCKVIKVTFPMIQVDCFSEQVCLWSIPNISENLAWKHLLQASKFGAAQLRFENNICSCTGHQKHVELHPIALDHSLEVFI